MSTPNRPWLDADDTLLRTWYDREPTRQVAVRLNRSVDATSKRASVLGLKKPRIGARAGNAEPVGTLRRAGRQQYWFIKVAERGPWRKAWRRLHYVKWEAVHGPVPADCVLTFKDGDVENTDPSNLDLVRKVDWIDRYNPNKTLPPELARIIRLKAVLTRTVNQLLKDEA